MTRLRRELAVFSFQLVVSFLETEHAERKRMRRSFDRRLEGCGSLISEP